jgi:hypothetical protein
LRLRIRFHIHRNSAWPAAKPRPRIGEVALRPLHWWSMPAERGCSSNSSARMQRQHPTHQMIRCSQSHGRSRLPKNCPKKFNRGERNFPVQRPEAKIHWRDRYCPAETGNVKNRRQDPRRKRPLFDRSRFGRFGKTGWWCRQSHTNRSPNTFGGSMT